MKVVQYMYFVDLVVLAKLPKTSAEFCIVHLNSELGQNSRIM